MTNLSACGRKIESTCCVEQRREKILRTKERFEHGLISHLNKPVCVFDNLAIYFNPLI